MRMFLVIGVCLLAAPTLAQPLSERDAVQQALARHPAGRAAQFGVAAAEAGVERTGSAWLPRVHAVGQVMARGPVPTLTIDTGLTLPGATESTVITRDLGQWYSASASLEMAWRAWDSGARSAIGDVARSGVEIAKADARAQAVELAWAVRQAYLAQQFFSEVVRVSGQAVVVAQHDLAQAEASLKAGLSAPIVVAATRSRLAEREAQQSEGETGLNRARATLRLMLGRAPDTPLTLADPLDTLAQSEPPPPRPAPSVLRAQAAAEAKKAQAEAVDAGFWPTLDLVGSAGYADPQTFVQTSPGFIWQAGAQLRWSIFDGDAGRREQHQLAAERASLLAAAEAAEEARQRAQIDADAQRIAARAMVATARKRVNAAEAFLVAAQAGLAAGTATALDVEAARDRVDGAKLAVTRAWFDAARARADRLKSDGVAEEFNP